MFLYQGGQEVESGVYWEWAKKMKVVLRHDGYLPGDERAVYFRLPESYLLIPGGLLFLGMSMALPYGIGFVLFLALCVVHNILFALLTGAETLMKEVIAHVPAAYRPTVFFFTGRARRKKRNTGKDRADGR